MSFDETNVKYIEKLIILNGDMKYITALSAAAVIFLIVSAELMFKPPKYDVFFIVSILCFSVTIILCVTTQGLILRELDEYDDFIYLIKNCMVTIVRIIFSIGTAAFAMFELFNVLS